MKPTRLPLWGLSTCHRVRTWRTKFDMRRAEPHCKLRAQTVCEQREFQFLLCCARTQPDPGLIRDVVNEGINREKLVGREGAALLPSLFTASRLPRWEIRRFAAELAKRHVACCRLETDPAELLSCHVEKTADEPISYV